MMGLIKKCLSTADSVFTTKHLQQLHLQSYYFEQPRFITRFAQAATVAENDWWPIVQN